MILAILTKSSNVSYPTYKFYKNNSWEEKLLQ